MKKIQDFFAQFPVFTTKEFREYFGLSEEKSTLHNRLRQYVKQKKIIRIRQSLYYVVPAGQDAEHLKTDPYLILSKLGEDSIVAYHSALELLGYAHSTFFKYFYLSIKDKPVFSLQGAEYISVQLPKAFTSSTFQFGTEIIYREGMPIMVTGRERSFVDCFDRPGYAGGYEEIYRSIQKFPYLSFEVLFEYLTILGKKVLFAKVGFFLEQHKEKFYVDDQFLSALEKQKPSNPVYFSSRQKPGKLVKRWNLVVPEIVINEGWNELWQFQEEK